MKPFLSRMIVTVLVFATSCDDEQAATSRDPVAEAPDGATRDSSVPPDGGSGRVPPGYTPRSIIPEGYSPPSLLVLTPDQQLDIFAHIEDTYATTTAKRGPKVRELPSSPQPLAPRVTWRGKNYADDLATFMVDARMTGVLAVQRGEIVLERYALGRTKDDRWTSFSVGKSITSLLLGAALQDGSIGSLADPVTKYIPQLAGSGYDGVTVRQLITMTSGVKWNEDYADPNSDVAASSFWPGEPGFNPLVSYMRRLPRAAEPGTVFSYKTGETDMAGILVAYATGRGLADYLSEKIWAPFGMEQDAVWIVDGGSIERGGCCISMTLRDYARVGLFTLSGGMVEGKRVISEAYLREATTNQLLPPASGSYGYFWWIGPDDNYSARGIFGQMIHIDPSRELIVVVNAAFPSALSDEHVAALTAVVSAIGAVARP